MRFVELRPAPAREGFRLHPRITFLRGLDPAARVALVGMAHDVALGNVPDWEGTVEVDGTEHRLADAVRMVGETADSALIVPAESLPTAAGPGGADPSDAARGHEEAEERVADLESRIKDLADELAASGKIRSDMNARLASARSRIDGEAGSRLDRADGELGRAARLAHRPDPWSGMADPGPRIEQLRDLRAAFAQELDGLPSGDRPALAAAIATARAAISTGAVPSPEAAALAQVWSSLHQRLVGLESRIEAAGGGTEAAAARLEVARAAAKAAEDAAVPRSVLPEEQAHIDRLHEDVLAAEAKVGRGVRRSAAKEAHEAAVAALEEALEPLGHATWTAFRMGNNMVSVSPAALQAYERASAELEEAEAEWAELMARLERDTELQEVLDAMEQTLARAVELLGGDPFGDGDGDEDEDEDDPAVVTEALRNLTVDAAALGVEADAAIRHLRHTLAESHAIGHEEIRSDVATVVLAQSWLEVLEAADEAAVRILRDDERAVTELSVLEAHRDDEEADGLDDERSGVYEAEAVVAETRQALVDRVKAGLELYMLAVTELAVAQEHDDQVTDLESARILLDLAVRRLEGSPSAEAVTHLAPRVPRGLGGPIPIIVVMGNAPASKLDVLTAMPHDVQIVVVGKGAGLDEWIASVGPDVATAVDASALV